MLGKNTTTVTTSSGPPLVASNIADFYSLNFNNSIISQTNTKYLLYIHFNTFGRASNLPSSSSIPTVNQLKFPPTYIQSFTVLFVTLDESVKTFDRLPHQCTPEKPLHEIDAYLVFTVGHHLFQPFVSNQEHGQKMANLHCPSSGKT